MKLVIQIPCYNEEKNLPVTLKEIPSSFKGVESVEILVINDGSKDQTEQIAKDNGVKYVIGWTNNRGLAYAFKKGIEKSLIMGADLIVNLDADNQYNAADIQKIIDPIIAGNAEIVIGERPILSIKHFSIVKKILQKLGSMVVRCVSKTNIPDAPSGFRAISREAAMQLNVFSKYTYTLETIIQAGQKNMAIISVPISVNGKLRESRLVKNIFTYVQKSIFTMSRIFVVYRPFATFFTIGLVLFVLGVGLGVRYIYFVFMGSGKGHIQSVILAGVLSVVGFQSMFAAFIADLISVNRKLLEEIRFKQFKQIDIEKGFIDD